MGEDSSYKGWLVRFGTTYDEKIERSDIYKDRSFPLPNLRRCVLITTIARFPSDSIDGQKLHELDWDRVVIDEASMIPIANIIYPLYQAKPKQFIIAGDPLQIQPVAQVEQDENIYKMVELKSFTEPHTEPHDYEIKLLTTQYRSVPSVGEVFSRFAYGGVLEHARSEDSRRRANIDDVLDVAPLNIIKFPVSKYEGIYRAKRLGNTPYHVYSALLAYEFAAFLARKIGVAIPGESYSIGVISPYRAQADLIDRPVMNGGVVIKYNANARYTTDSVSAAVFGEICRAAGVPVQRYTNRADKPGGSTLGNISLSHVSLDSVDIGLAQLAMHSCYETAGAKDTEYLVRAMTEFYSREIRKTPDGIRIE